MGRFRVGLAAAFAWMFVFYNIERYHEPINLASFVYVLAAAAAVAALVIRRLDRTPLWLQVVGLLVLFLALKTWKGTPIAGPFLPLTVTEACALTITAILANRIAQSIREFEEAAVRVAFLDDGPSAASFDAAQSELYREVRRARRQRRPLALVALKPHPQQMPAAIPRVIEEAQKSCSLKLFERRLASVLARSVDDEGWVIQRGDHFLVLMPEYDHGQAVHIIERMEQAAVAELGVRLQRGLAAFPDEEITFTGLVERAEALMRGEEAPLPEHGWSIASLDAPHPRGARQPDWLNSEPVPAESSSTS
ncbi:MAG: hypothetical protein KY475_16115 [Planctomycetes bacterium]|nr:hypothetical protein [Planctomycetota bacterium]